jgi:serine/threonine protein phosphatase PrpC
MNKKVFSYSLQGRRASNEDTHINITNLNGSNNKINPINLFGVFDGHGGKNISTFLKKSLVKYYINKYNLFNLCNKKEEFFNIYTKKLYDKLHNKIINEYPRVSKNCGSTACVGVQYKNILWLINVGDSRAIRCNKSNIAEQLTLDHKPNVPQEKKRIYNLGGTIEFDGYDWRVDGLSLSRAFGDINSMPYITYEPDIYKYEILDDKFIIFGCDGLYDNLNNQEIIDFILELYNNKFNGNYAKELAEYAYNKGSLDNITVIVYFV